MIPADFTPHDGGPCPVPLDSKPAVLFRDGLLIDNHLAEAREWQFPRDGIDLWQRGKKDGPADIIYCITGSVQIYPASALEPVESRDAET